MPQRDPVTGRFVSGEPTVRCRGCSSTSSLEHGYCEVCRDYCTVCEEEGLETTVISDRVICYSCEDMYTRVCQPCGTLRLDDEIVQLHEYSDTAEDAVPIGPACKQCLVQFNAQYNTIIRKWQLRPPEHRDNKIVIDNINHDMSIVYSGQTSYVITASAREINRNLILEINSNRAPSNIIKIREEEETLVQEMPEYQRMPREGNCIYMCGNNISQHNYSEPLACQECVPTQLCQECSTIGTEACPRCINNKRLRIETEQTTLRLQAIRPNNYHPREHVEFKSKKLRMPDERPYLYYGVEIEVEIPSAVDREAFAETICTVARGLFVAERDGSLRNGVEFISRPLSYKKWASQEILDILKEVYEKFNAFGIFTVSQKSAGMHVHMSKVFFQKSKNKTVEQQKEDMSWIFEYYDEEISKISMRKLNNFCTSKRMMGYNAVKGLRIMSNNYSLTIDKEGPVQSMGSGETHHHMITETQRTFELRTFSTPTVWQQILAAIEMSRNIAHFARKYKLDNVNLHQIMSSKKSDYLDAHLRNIGLDLSSTRDIKDTITIKINRGE